MKLTRREVVVAGAGSLAACGRSELLDEIEGPAASGPEEEDVTVIRSKQPETTLPVHLTASATLASNTTGGVNAVALKNPLGTAMEIHQIKWMISGTAQSTARNIFGGIIACKLDLGTNPITNGFVPVWLFGRPEDLLLEVLQYGDGTQNQTSFFSWRLPRPLFIPAGAVLTPTFQHRGLFQHSLTARISYVGRSLLSNRARPKKVCVPYVASFVSPNFDFTPDTSVAASAESRETDIVNPHPEPLFIQRFVGRIQTYIDGLDGVSGVTSASEVDYPGVDAQFTTRMTDSNGRPVIQDFTQFRVAFPAPTRTWDMDNGAVMDPNSYYKLFLRTTPTGVTWAPEPLAAFAQAHVGMVGWREIGGP